MTTDSKVKKTKNDIGHLFAKKNKVSIWVSQHPYEMIPDEYFEETFFKNGARARNTWSNNFKIRYFMPDQMETNGAHTGTIDIKTAAGQCSCSSSFIDALIGKARKKKLEHITWIILLFEHEYSVKFSGINKDDYTTFLGVFDYDATEDRVYTND